MVWGCVTVPCLGYLSGSCLCLQWRTPSTLRSCRSWSGCACSSTPLGIPTSQTVSTRCTTPDSGWLNPAPILLLLLFLLPISVIFAIQCNILAKCQYSCTRHVVWCQVHTFMANCKTSLNYINRKCQTSG